jgi:hypothetical protein
LTTAKLRPQREPAAGKPILLIGKDEVFARGVQQAAAAANVQVLHCRSPFDVVPDFRPEQFSVAIVDAQGPSSFDAAYFIDMWAPALPVVLVCAGRLWVTSKLALPRCVRDFVPKAAGASAIVDEACAISRMRAEYGPN